MACHKGSVFGALGEEPQPSSEQLRPGCKPVRCEKHLLTCFHGNGRCHNLYALLYLQLLFGSCPILLSPYDSSFSSFNFLFRSFTLLWNDLHPWLNHIESILASLDQLRNFPMVGVDVKNWIPSQPPQERSCNGMVAVVFLKMGLLGGVAWGWCACYFLKGLSQQPGKHDGIATATRATTQNSTILVVLVISHVIYRSLQEAIREISLLSQCVNR